MLSPRPAPTATIMTLTQASASHTLTVSSWMSASRMPGTTSKGIAHQVGSEAKTLIFSISASQLCLPAHPSSPTQLASTRNGITSHGHSPLVPTARSRLMQEKPLEGFNLAETRDLLEFTSPRTFWSMTLLRSRKVYKTFSSSMQMKVALSFSKSTLQEQFQ